MQTKQATESWDTSNFSELLGLLTILAKQLDMSLGESDVDFATICAWGIPLLDGSGSDDGATLKGDKTRDELIFAMQFHDRMSQRVSHVSESLKMVATHLNDIANHSGEVTEWDNFTLDLTNELKKTLSYFNTGQTAEMCEMVSKNSEWLLNHDGDYDNKIEKIDQNKGEDVEFF